MKTVDSYKTNKISFFLISSYSCVIGTDDLKHKNTVELFGEIDPKVSLSSEGVVAVLGCVFITLEITSPNSLCNTQASKHRRTDRSVLCCLRKAEAGKSWPRLTKDKTKVTLTLKTTNQSSGM